MQPNIQTVYLFITVEPSKTCNINRLILRISESTIEVKVKTLSSLGIKDTFYSIKSKECFVLLTYAKVEGRIAAPRHAARAAGQL